MVGPGCSLALLIIGLWLSSLVPLGWFDPFTIFGQRSLQTWIAVAAIILVRTFLQTGLFIVAHDAMHGSLVPRRPGLNTLLGQICLGLYAAIPYRLCHSNHLRHHRNPGGGDDPDFHDGRHNHPLSWYITFMGGYLSTAQIGWLLAIWACALAGLTFTSSHPVAVLVLFWVLPLILSSMQLFLFGTYLPHRAQSASPGSCHQVGSSSLPPAISLLACYHFDYHWEHHHHPDSPWYTLPSLRRSRLKKELVERHPCARVQPQPGVRIQTH
ncbi:fatty acid desaturase [Synechococcus sp. CS-1325]|nr:fatty acid desaturase [Synechococcus sp. CS-1325]PZU99543.1 MAG: beta-carotene ketolase [Cyanobium sp.]